jgi:hypothetical protein
MQMFGAVRLVYSPGYTSLLVCRVQLLNNCVTVVAAGAILKPVTSWAGLNPPFSSDFFSLFIWL